MASMAERPPDPEKPEEPGEPGEPDEPTEISEPEEPTEVTEAEEPTEVSEPEEPTEVTEPTESSTAEAWAEPPTEEKAVTDTTAEEVTAAPTPRAEPRLTRSRDDRVIAGVCGGLARYVGIDPILVRIAALLLIFAGGVGIVLYVIGWIAIPEERAVVDGVVEAEPDLDEDELERRRGAAVLGILFVVVGIFFLLDEVWPDLSWQYIWPVALIAVGLAIVLRGRR
jgi:phage shock protein C